MLMGFFWKWGVIFVRQLWANESLFVPVYHIQGCLSRSGMFVTFRVSRSGLFGVTGMFVTFRAVCHVQGCLSHSGIFVSCVKGV